MATAANQQPATVPAHQQAQQPGQSEEDTVKASGEPHVQQLEPESTGVAEEPYVEEKPEVVEPPQEEVQIITQEQPGI